MRNMRNMRNQRRRKQIAYNRITNKLSIDRYIRACYRVHGYR